MYDLDTNMLGVRAVEIVSVSSIHDKSFKPTAKSSQFIMILSLDFTACEERCDMKIK